MAQMPACEFWDFSLAVYGRDGVAPACLSLQERHGVDVNLLLFGCWLAASGRGALAGEALLAAAAAVAPWHGEIVRALRATRMRLKGERAPLPAGTEAGLTALAESLRKRIAALELEAEHLEQLLLAATAPSPRPRRAQAERAADGAIAVSAYLAFLGAPLDAADLRALAAVLMGVFPEASRGEIEALLAAAAPPSQARGRGQGGTPKGGQGRAGTRVKSRYETND